MVECCPAFFHANLHSPEKLPPPPSKAHKPKLLQSKGFLSIARPVLGVASTLLKREGMKYLRREPRGWRLTRGAALIASLPVLCGCAYHQQLHWSPLVRSAAIDGAVSEHPRKGDATRAISGGSLDPAEVTFNSQNLEQVFRAPEPGAFSLAFFTDAGLVDRTIGLGDCVEHFIEKNPFFWSEDIRRGFIQDYTDALYMACLLKAFRSAAERGLIQAVVNGGDSVQIGVRPEFETHVELVGKYLIAGHSEAWEKEWQGTWWQTPLAGTAEHKATFYQVIGNHEVLFLGTFNRSGAIRVPSDAVRDASSFSRLVGALAPWRERTEAGNTNAALGEGTFRRGYYCIPHAMPDGKRVLLVVLNTSQGTVCDFQNSTPNDVFFHSSMSSDQLEWLTSTLASAEQNTKIGAVLVFGHHPLAEVAVRTGHRRPVVLGELPRRLARFAKVKAYFCGHLHSGCSPLTHGGPHPVTEYVVPSLMAFPKSFALIRLSPLPGPSGYRLTVQHHNLTELMEFRPQMEWEAQQLGHGGNQRRFEAYLARLSRITCSRAERVQQAAVDCYLDAARDLGRHRSRRFPECFPKEAAAELSFTYRQMQPVWELLKERARGTPAEAPRIAWAQIASALEGSFTPPFVAGLEAAEFKDQLQSAAEHAWGKRLSPEQAADTAYARGLAR